MRMAFAQTGPPAQASAVLSPIARRKVLFPDIFDPETISKRMSRPNETSLPTDLASGRSGCLTACPSKIETGSEMSSGKHQCGRSKLRDAKEESASKVASACSHEATCGPESRRHRSTPMAICSRQNRSGLRARMSAWSAESCQSTHRAS